MAPLRLISILRSPTHSYPSPLALRTRAFTNHAARFSPRKGFEDRESMNTEATEYSKSGTDDQAAHSEEAFDPSTTRPEQETKEAGKDSDALKVSPGNRDVSKQGGKEAEGGPEGAARNKKSGAGSGPKNG